MNYFYDFLSNINTNCYLKLSESNSQCDQLEKQLLKLEKRQTSIPNKEKKQTINETNDETLESLHFLLASRISNAQNDVSLVKQLHELKNDKKRLENELQKRNQEFEELINKYDKRKSRHRERLLRLRYEIDFEHIFKFTIFFSSIRSHIERENRQLQELLNTTDFKYKLAEEELQRHKKYCAISDKNAIIDKN